MFETTQMTFVVPNILPSVPLLAFVVAKIFIFFFFIESWLSSREGDFANHGSIATKVLGVQRGEPGLAVGAVKGGRRKRSI